jgi:UDP-N-acetylglucosamine 2-epimerase (non-hydrolysing)
MLDQVLNVFGIAPDVDLNIMKVNQTLAELSARLIYEIDKYLAAENPDLILIQGDTTTTLCAALSAFYRRIPIGHIEAGLRTWDLMAPWPEEANRVLTSRLATLHFAPTEHNKQNLLNEGVSASQIFVTGNTVVDALILALKKIKEKPIRIDNLPPNLKPDYNGKRPRMVLITGHRRENFGKNFENICKAIASLAKSFPKVQFTYPVHLNPNVRKPVKQILGSENSSSNNIHLMEPISYLPFIALMDQSYIILTDSGGVQEEAPSLGKPLLLMRETTERPEGVSAGTVQVVGSDVQSIVKAVSELLTNKIKYKKMSRTHNPYGDGRTAIRIINSCKSFLQ